MAARLIFVVLIAFAVGVMGAIFWRGQIPGAGEQGKALIGGPFTLTNHKGKTVTDKAFRGKYMLVAFGYTFCPDICPAELNVMSEAMEKLGDRAAQVTPIFITIDPLRDTPQVMSDYISSFHSSFVGLTGSPEQIRAAAGAYRAYYGKSPGSASKEDYLMDHSVFIYLMGPDGQYLTHFTYGISSEVMSKKIQEVLVRGEV